MGELSSEVYSKFLFFLTNPSSFESIQPLITASPCSDSGSRAILGERDSGLNKVYDCETRTDNREFLDRSKQWKPPTPHLSLFLFQSSFATLSSL